MRRRLDRWHDATDVVVIGSGGAGLAAALSAHDAGADVMLLERSSLIGGTTSVSGGVIWAPLNRHAQMNGVDDSIEEVQKYLDRVMGGTGPDRDLLDAYLDHAAEAVHYLEDATALELTVCVPFTDYFADLSGGKCVPARALEPRPFDAGSELGPWSEKVRRSPHLPSLTMQESAAMLSAASPEQPLAEKRDRDDVRVLGSALVGGLLKGLLDRGVEVQTETRVRELVITDERGVAGVRVERCGRVESIGTRKGVVIASGGFEWNPTLMRAFITEPLTPMSPPENEGDGLIMAMEVGAALANMSAFWGTPGLLDPEAEFEGRPMPQTARARAAPGVIIVNRYGRRFVNEACAYQDFSRVIGEYDPVRVGHPNRDHWMVFDQRVKDNVRLLPSIPAGAAAPAWIDRADSIRGLAQRTGIDAEALELTVGRWNAHVSDGNDPDFHRGTLWYEGYITGGPDKKALLAPVDTPPFYAAKLVQATQGTRGGPLTDRNGRVRSVRGGVIERLYAAGNVAASPLGFCSPGGGATLGPALTLGYLAGRHVGSLHSDREILAARSSD